MKKHTLPVLAALGLFAMLAALPAFAQSSAKLTVNIPFEFAVGKTVLPAGQYTVAIRNPGSGFLRIESADRGRTVFMHTYIAYANGPMNESSLVFNRYGNQQFLSKVWAAGADVGCELPKSGAEREINRALRLAKDTSQDQTVTIAAHRQ